MSLNVHSLRILLIAGRAKGSTMLQTIFALGVAGLISAVVPGTSQAAPMLLSSTTAVAPQPPTPAMAGATRLDSLGFGFY
jgi:hypothetical protein